MYIYYSLRRSLLSIQQSSQHTQSQESLQFRISRTVRVLIEASTRQKLSRSSVTHDILRHLQRLCSVPQSLNNATTTRTVRTGRTTCNDHGTAKPCSHPTRHVDQSRRILSIAVWSELHSSTRKRGALWCISPEDYRIESGNLGVSSFEGNHGTCAHSYFVRPPSSPITDRGFCHEPTS